MGTSWPHKAHNSSRAQGLLHVLPDVLRFVFDTVAAVETGAAHVRRVLVIACVDMLAAAAECCTAQIVDDFGLANVLLRYTSEPDLRLRACEGLFWLCSRRLEGTSREFSVRLFSDIGGGVAACNLEPDLAEYEFQHALCRLVVALGVRHVNVLDLAREQDLALFAAYLSLVLKFSQYPGISLLSATCDVWQTVLARLENASVVRAPLGAGASPWVLTLCVPAQASLDVAIILPLCRVMAVGCERDVSQRRGMGDPTRRTAAADFIEVEFDNDEESYTRAMVGLRSRVLNLLRLCARNFSAIAAAFMTERLAADVRCGNLCFGGGILLKGGPFVCAQIHMRSAIRGEDGGAGLGSDAAQHCEITSLIVDAISGALQDSAVAGTVPPPPRSVLRWRCGITECRPAA